MPQRLSTFDRQFEPGDQRLFAGLVQELVGQPCIAWRKSYGRTGSLHYGALVANRAFRPKTVTKEHGTWVVGLWDCDRKVTWSTGETLDSRKAGDDALLARLNELEGARVQDIRLDHDSLALEIKDSNGITLKLIPDAASDTRDEQWAIELPSGLAVTVFGKGRWALQENR